MIKFGVTRSIKEDVEMKSFITQEFEEQIQKHLVNKSYGPGVISIILGFICVAAGFEQFFKLRKPKYYKDPTLVKGDPNFPVTVEKTVEIEFNVDYMAFKEATGSELIELVKSELIKAIDSLDKLKIPDFDKASFKDDFIEAVNNVNVSTDQYD